MELPGAMPSKVVQPDAMPSKVVQPDAMPTEIESSDPATSEAPKIAPGSSDTVPSTQSDTVPSTQVAAVSCSSEAMPIASLQGHESTSPYVGHMVTTTGVVTASFLGTDGFRGFFIQSEEPDADPQTSEGLFVYVGATAISLMPGDVVVARGIVLEYFGLTELSLKSLSICGQAALPTPAELSLVEGAKGTWEALENMLVVTRSATVLDTSKLAVFGELTLGQERLFHPNNQSSPRESHSDHLLLDDGKFARLAQTDVAALHDMVPHLLFESTVRLGDSVPTVTGVLHYAFGSYRIQPTLNPIPIQAENPRPAPPSRSSSLRVVAFNVHNYFATLAQRGAATQAEFERQTAKLVAAIEQLDPSIVALFELENQLNQDGVPIASNILVDALSSHNHSSPFASVQMQGSSGTDAITMALIYRPDHVTLLGKARFLEEEAFVRPPLEAQFLANDQVLALTLLHLKSRAGCPHEATDENADFGQGCFNAQRTREALALIKHLKQGGDFEKNTVVLGDFNAYATELPLTHLSEAGLFNLVTEISPKERYSYVFSAVAGALDHVLVSPALRKGRAAFWHINADEPLALDYSSGNLAQDDAFRSSDHDPLIFDLEL